MKPSASKYFKDSLSLLLFLSTITIFLQFLTFDNINPQSKPIAPDPIIKALISFIDLESSFSPSSTKYFSAKAKTDSFYEVVAIVYRWAQWLGGSYG